MERRDFLKTSALIGMSSLAASCGGASLWQAAAFRKTRSSQVAILKAASYEDDLTRVVLDGIKACHLSVAGKTVLEAKPRRVRGEAVINTSSRTGRGCS
jgi:hypothetical protein